MPGEQGAIQLALDVCVQGGHDSSCMCLLADSHSTLQHVLWRAWSQHSATCVVACLVNRERSSLRSTSVYSADAILALDAGASFRSQTLTALCRTGVPGEQGTVQLALDICVQCGRYLGFGRRRIRSLTDTDSTL